MLESVNVEILKRAKTNTAVRLNRPYEKIVHKLGDVIDYWLSVRTAIQPALTLPGAETSPGPGTSGSIGVHRTAIESPYK